MRHGRWTAAIGLAAVAAITALQVGGATGSAAGTVVATKSAKLTVVNDSSLTLSQPNESPRAVALCPGRLEPYGGALNADPDPLPLVGEGVYPHSYERLGAQSGFHSTPVLFSPLSAVLPGLPSVRVRSYQITLQVICGKKPGKLADPHDIALDVPSGTSRTLVAKCPKKTVLIGGGFQRAAFEAGGGVYPTESHAISKTRWQASGTAFGRIRNDMVSIGYCMASPKRKPLLKEVSSSVSILPGQVGFTTTPPCPSGRRMVWSGFDTDPKTGGPAQRAMLFADGIFTGNETFTASAYNGTTGAGTLTAYGYCLKERVIGGSLKKFTKKVGRIDTPIPESQRMDKRGGN